LILLVLKQVGRVNYYIRASLVMVIRYWNTVIDEWQ